MTKAKRIGPRMRELCSILAAMGGTAPSQSSVYLRLVYPGGSSSNFFGSRVMERAMSAGLVEIDGPWPGPGKPIPVRLTEDGYRVTN